MMKLQDLVTSFSLSKRLKAAGVEQYTGEKAPGGLYLIETGEWREGVNSMSETFIEKMYVRAFLFEELAAMLPKQIDAKGLIIEPRYLGGEAVAGWWAGYFDHDIGESAIGFHNVSLAELAGELLLKVRDAL